VRAAQPPYSRRMEVVSILAIGMNGIRMLPLLQINEKFMDVGGTASTANTDWQGKDNMVRITCQTRGGQEKPIRPAAWTQI